MVPDQRFERCGTHTSVDKSKFPLGSIWIDARKGLYGRVVGYPLNDYYHDDYVGMCYFDENGQYVSYGASRAVNLKPTNRFLKNFEPEGEPGD